MSRYAETQDSPPQPTLEGDSAFTALDMKTERSQLPPGTVSLLINKRLLNGSATKRPGITTPTFANSFSATTVTGSGAYSNPNGDEVLLVASAGRVFQLQSGLPAQTIAIPHGAILINSEFSQQFDQVLLHHTDANGNPLNTLVWDGTPSGSFVYVEKGSAIASLTKLPNAAWSINFGNRALFPLSRDSYGATDIDDFTEYDAALHNFRVNTGTADQLVGLYPAQGNRILVGKTKSFDLQSDFVGDLGDAYVLSGGANGQAPPAMEEIPGVIGMISRRAGIWSGGNFYFLSKATPGGIFRIQQNASGQLYLDELPISNPIEPLIKRINWSAANKAVASSDGINLRFAVPIDGSAVNNALLVYSLVTGQWHGLDTYAAAAGVQIDNLVVADFFGVSRVYAVNNAAGQVYLLEEGKVDQVGHQNYPIADVFESRGYATLGWNASTRRAFERFVVALGTWRPNITITELTEQANDARVKTPVAITADRTKYKQWARPDFSLDNHNGDFAVPGRQDYAVLAGDGVILGEAGVPCQIKQRQVIPFVVQTRAGYVSYRVESSDGDCDVLGILLESSGTQKDENRRAA